MIDPLQEPVSPVISADGSRLAYISQPETSGAGTLAVYEAANDSTTFMHATVVTRPLISDDGRLVLYHGASISTWPTPTAARASW